MTHGALHVAYTKIANDIVTNVGISPRNNTTVVFSNSFYSKCCVSTVSPYTYRFNSSLKTTACQQQQLSELCYLYHAWIVLKMSGMFQHSSFEKDLGYHEFIGIFFSICVTIGYRLDGDKE